MLINGVHHARELLTISQVAYNMMAILHGYEHNRNDLRALLETSALVFIPLVNPDGVYYIDEAYKRTHRWEYIRKNRHIYPDMHYCKDAEDQGVDLNRNYPHMFKHDD